MNKHAIRIEIGQILDNRCGPCPYGGWKAAIVDRRRERQARGSRLVKECYTCPHYKRLRDLGRILGSEEREMSETLTVENFVAWKKAGLLNKAIANKVGKSPSNLSSWAAYHSKEIDAEMAKQHKKPGPKTGQAVNAEVKGPRDPKDVRIDKLIKDKSELTKRLDLCNTSISRLNEELNTTKRDYVHLRGHFAKLQDAFDESARSEADAHKKVDELQKQLDLLRNENNRLRKDNDCTFENFETVTKQRDIALNLIHVMTDV